MRSSGYEFRTSNEKKIDSLRRAVVGLTVCLILMTLIALTECYFLFSNGIGALFRSFSSTPSPSPTTTVAITPTPAPTMKPLTEPISLGAGTFTAGVDFPAGRYVVRVPDTTFMAKFRLYERASDIIGTSYWLGTQYGGPTAIVEIGEGGRIELTQSRVTIEPYTASEQ